MDPAYKLRILQKGTLVAMHKMGIFFTTLVSDNADLNCEGVVIHKAGDGDRKLDHLFRCFSMTIGAPQQFSILNTKTRTTSTVVHKANYENWQLDHILMSLSP
jgi:hypothetical protein